VNGLYFIEWPKCPDCGLRESGAHTNARCIAVQSGRMLGGKVLDISRSTIDELPEPPPPNFLGQKPPPGTWRDFFEAEPAELSVAGYVSGEAPGGGVTGILIVGQCRSCGGRHEFEAKEEKPAGYTCPRTNQNVAVKW
jgi:hypothetical protein